MLNTAPLCGNPKRCEAFLRDLCPEHKREINVLIGALRENTASDLMNASDILPKKIILTRLTKQLQDNQAYTEDAAKWAVDSWALALGVITNARPTAKKLAVKSKFDSVPKRSAVKSKFDSVSSDIYRLRSESLKLSDEDVRDIIRKHNFYSGTFFISGKKWQNILGDFRNDFTDNGNGTVTDAVTGLVWQKSGSSKDTFKNAKSCIQGLNKKEFAGYSDWRLPTLEELASLLEEKEVNGLYIDPLFDRKQRNCWSSDKRASRSAWFNFNSAWIVSFVSAS
ncbi:MAG: DUF1566 domain-containing protein [Desulfobacteraceae bacterium]|nr:DUF1566 domain-containing protein [Desulfobacteraceae bacterium]